MSSAATVTEFAVDISSTVTTISELTAATKHNADAGGSTDYDDPKPEEWGHNPDNNSLACQESVPKKKPKA